MALTQLSILSSRAADQVWLVATEVNILGADYASTTTLPTGFGDCLLLEVTMVGTGLGAIADPANKAILWWLDDVASAVQDVIAVSQLYAFSAAGVASVGIPDQVRYWKANERLNISLPDLETATTTGDIAVRALVRRLVTS